MNIGEYGLVKYSLIELVLTLEKKGRQAGIIQKENTILKNVHVFIKRALF